MSRLVAGLSWLLGGVLYPVGALPDIAQVVAWCLPITHALDATRSAVILGDSVSAIGDELLWLGLFSTLTLPLSLYSFRLAVRQLRREGTVSHY